MFDNILYKLIIDINNKKNNYKILEIDELFFCKDSLDQMIKQ
jgi:hypothetical protein